MRILSVLTFPSSFTQYALPLFGKGMASNERLASQSGHLGTATLASHADLTLPEGRLRAALVG